MNILLDVTFICVVEWIYNNVFILCTEGHGPMVQYINNNNNVYQCI